MDFVTEQGLVPKDGTVVDLGCGFGVMAKGLASLAGAEGRYVGFDLHAPSIVWAQKELATYDARLRFIFLNVAVQPLPIHDQDADFVLAKSLFTHLDPGGVRNALAEISRVLRPGDGRALMTTFLFSSESPPSHALPFSRSDSKVRWRVRVRPQAAMGYEFDYFMSLLVESNLQVVAFVPSFWPGKSRLDAQDYLIVRRAS